MFDLFNPPPDDWEKLDKDSYASAMEGLNTAIKNADAKIPGWSDMVKALFRKWAASSQKGIVFRVQEFRLFCKQQGLPDPPSKRAFGFLPDWAQDNKLVVRAGFTWSKGSKKSHSTPVSAWKLI